MSWRESGKINLDYEDLVKELDQFEQEARSLQDRISRWMDDAEQVTGEGADGSADSGDED